MSRYGSWFDQVDAGTKSDLHDAFIAEMERSLCRECGGTGEVADGLADGNYGSWFVPCPTCSFAARVEDES